MPFLVSYFILAALILFFTEQLTSATGISVLFYFGTLTTLLVNYKHYKNLVKLWLIGGVVLINAFALIYAVLVLVLPITFISPFALLVISALSLVILFCFAITSVTLQLNLKNAEIDELKTNFAQEKLTFEDILQENQDDLESKVQERTLELHIALQELEDVNRELAEKSTLDDLTGLYNRRYYDQKMLAEYRRSRRNLSPLSLIVVDIDYFKKVNDSYGHIAGDECLKAVAKLIKTSLHRSSDIPCRYGGEEFCLIMPETSSGGACAFADELRLKIAQLVITYQEHTIPLTISCGVSTYEQQTGSSPETIFAAADHALYQAKQLGRNRVELADTILLKRSEE